jgi:hypothetical protein
MHLKDHLIDRLQIARKWTTNLLTDIEPQRWFNMPGGGTGHVAWQVGHLAASQIVLIHNRCFGKPLDACMHEAERLVFGRGSTPVGDPSKYPPIAAIRATFDRIQNEAIEMIRTLTDADLDAPAGDAHPLFANKAGAIGTAALHETFHAGQIAMIRRVFGKAPLR